MTLLEVDLGQVNTYDTDATRTQNNIIKSIGLIINNQSKLDMPIQLLNRPVNNFFNVRKTGNTLDYILILSFEEM